MKKIETLAQESLEIRARFDEEPSHSDHVATLALQLFDGLQPWHKMEAHSRELLHAAALLHDIGWSQTPDGKGHHKWSARLIREHSWRNLAPAEVEIVALTARYHRKLPPQPEDTEFNTLKGAEKKSVMVLGGILRIADALDRTHTARITRVEVSVEKEEIVVRVQPSGGWNSERVTFEIKSDMLQAAAMRPLSVEEK
jgi:exopolyphosphatase / guanosine-5'-triphosphate,3'-diphosphate pyrophosphatase